MTFRKTIRDKRLKDIIRRIFRIKDKPATECLHQPRYREYYREGCYKCWECHKIIVD